MKRATINVSESEVTELYMRLKKEAEAAGYHLNPDVEFTKDLVKSLIINQKRYGYQACPCRLSSGKKNDDMDIICPCDYRDKDIEEYGACYCGLYVSEEIIKGLKQIEPIPERRPLKKIREEQQAKKEAGRTLLKTDKDIKVWRCKVCGYLCARDEPPERCPICKATKDRFEVFSK